MTAVDRKYALNLLHTGRDTQESRAALFTEKAATRLTLQAETRSYTLALLIDAIKDGLLEQLHAEAQQRLLVDMAVAQDNEWAAYAAGMGAAPEDTAPLAIPVFDDTNAGAALLEQARADVAASAERHHGTWGPNGGDYIPEDGPEVHELPLLDGVYDESETGRRAVHAAEVFERHQANIARDTETAPACARCKVPFDPEDTSYTGSAQYDDTPYCMGCIDNCHEGGADHRCIICAPRDTESGS